MSEKEIATTINDQLKWSGLPVYWSWGINALSCIPKSEKFYGGLQAKVNGAKHSGIIRVYLTYGDDYTIELIKNGRTIKTVEGVYCDELSNIVDGLIETN
jgi:hypothetical protein